MKYVVNFSDFAGMISDPAVVINGENIVYMNSAASKEFPSLQTGSNICRFLTIPLMSIETIGDTAYPFTYRGVHYSIRTALFNNETFIIFRKNAETSYSFILQNPQSAINIAAQLRDFLSLSFISFAQINRIMEDEDRQKFGEPLSVIRRSMFQSLNMVNHLDLLSNAFSGKLMLHRSTIDIVERIKLLVEKVKLLVSDMNFSLDFRSGIGSGFIVSIDMGKIETAILCALSNAIKYTVPNGYITVTVMFKSYDLIIQIENLGYGMADTSSLSVRRKFMTPPSFSDPKAGIGFGVSVIDEIVSLHGGTLDIKSVPGSSTVFTMAIPLSSISNDEDTGRMRVLKQDLTQNILVELSDVLDSEKYILK